MFGVDVQTYFIFIYSIIVIMLLYSCYTAVSVVIFLSLLFSVGKGQEHRRN